jgi:hypothetical protein
MPGAAALLPCSFAYSLRNKLLALHCVALHCTALCCTALCCTALCCTALCCSCALHCASPPLLSGNTKMSCIWHPHSLCTTGTRNTAQARHCCWRDVSATCVLTQQVQPGDAKGSAATTVCVPTSSATSCLCAARRCRGVEGERWAASSPSALPVSFCGGGGAAGPPQQADDNTRAGKGTCPHFACLQHVF